MIMWIIQEKLQERVSSLNLNGDCWICTVEPEEIYTAQNDVCLAKDKRTVHVRQMSIY